MMVCMTRGWLSGGECICMPWVGDEGTGGIL